MLEAMRPIRAFYPGPHCDAAAAKRLQYELKCASGAGLAWVHPGFAHHVIYHPDPDQPKIIRHPIEKMLGPDYDRLKALFPEQEYRIYCERLRQNLVNRRLPILLFIDHTERDKTMAFLQSFTAPPVEMIEVPTEFRDPVPFWGGYMPPRESWGRLADILKNLGFVTIKLIGELSYWGYGTEQEGCVPGVRKALVHFGFNVITEDDHTFPNGET
jgi:hypothetical protein